MVKKKAKRVLVLCFVSVLLLQGTAFALDGSVIFRDSLYGAAVGALIGVGLYAIDQNDAGSKIGGGVVAGTVVGALVGVADSRSMVSVEDGKVFVRAPVPAVRMDGRGVVVRSDLLRVGF